MGLLTFFQNYGIQFLLVFLHARIILGRNLIFHLIKGMSGADKANLVNLVIEIVQSFFPRKSKFLSGSESK